MASERAPAGRRALIGRPGLSVLALGVVLLVTTALRFTVNRDQPLWLDETWTAMTVSRPTLRDLAHELHQDVNAPLYYLLAWVAAPGLGLSNAALRLPAALFGALAPVVCLWLPDRRLGRLWCALSALWVAGLIYSQEARCFTLVWALCTASTVAFARLLARPRPGGAALWVGLATLAVLTHYFAAWLALAQAGVLAWRLGRGVFRLWPAALVALPGLAWLAFHAPRIAEFAALGDSWYPRLTFWTALNLAREAAGSDLLAGLALGIGGALLWRRAGARALPLSPAETAALASVVAAALVLALDLVHPSLTARYLFAFAPGLLLGLAALALRPDRALRGGPALLVGAFAISAALWAATRPVPLSRNFSWEGASAWIMQTNPARLVFVWDNPTSPIIWPDSMARAGGFFFQRAGRALPADAVTRLGGDPNAILRPLPAEVAIIWIYDSTVNGTAAVAHPPDLAAPGRECRRFGRWWMNVYACRPAHRPVAG